MEKVFITKNSAETQKIAFDLAKRVFPPKADQPQAGKIKNNKNAVVLGLFGDLGSGKTVFTKGFAKALGIKKIITSPTFVLEKIYKTSNKKYQHLIHIDAYRIRKAKEISDLGWKELVKNPKNIILAEWADRVSKILPKDAIKIKFSHLKGDKRKISIGQNLWTN